MLSKALITGVYQQKAEEIARLGVDLVVLVPPVWEDRRGRQVLEIQPTESYELRVLPIRFNGNYHLHHYPGLAKELARLTPDVVHMDEEPYNTATWLGLRAAERVGAVGTFFTWQNLYRQYPPPFRWFEQANYRRTPVAIAGNSDAAEVLRRKGFAGEIAIIPQFGVDPEIFHPAEPRQDSPVFRIGYAGGLIPEKGVELLIRACAGLQGDWRLEIVGEGSERARLAALAQKMGIGERVRLGQRLASGNMPDFYRSLDVVVLPSRTANHWKEQFGRVLIEAMACEVPVIGSDSGEIPNVIGAGDTAGGLIFPEEDVAALRAHLQSLLDQPERRRKLGQAGRRRVLECFTMAQVARETVAVYTKLMEFHHNRGRNQ
jgi:glycosyltransferase involved in cell wall biosynthesis